MAQELSPIAVVRSASQPIVGGRGFAMAVAGRGQATRQVLVGVVGDGVVAVAADPSADNVRRLPVLLRDPGARAVVQEPTLDRLLLRLADLDPDRPMVTVEVGRDNLDIDVGPERAEGSWYRDGRRARKATRVDWAREAEGNGLVSRLRVCGYGSWAPYEDPQLTGSLNEGFVVVEFVLPGWLTAAQARLRARVLPTATRPNDWTKDRVTGRWHARDPVLGDLVREIERLQIRRRQEGNRLVLVGHLEIDFENRAIAYTGTSLRVPLASDTSRRLEQRLATRGLFQRGDAGRA